MFELNGVKYEFKRVSVENALRIQQIMSESEQISDPKRSQELERELLEIAYSHLVICLKEGNTERKIDCGADDLAKNKDYVCDLFGSNPFFLSEIIISFSEVIRGFLELLPTIKKRQSESTLKIQNSNIK